MKMLEHLPPDDARFATKFAPVLVFLVKAGHGCRRTADD